MKAPSLDDLLSEDRASAKKLSLALFYHAPPALSSENGKLGSFRDAMSASLIMYFNSFEEKYGSQHRLHQVITDIAKSIDVSISQIRSWSRTINEAFQSANIDLGESSSLEQQALQEITVKMAEALKYSKALNFKVDEIDKKVSGLVTLAKSNQGVLLSKLGEILEALELSSSSVDTNPNKRSRVDEPPLPPLTVLSRAAVVRDSGTRILWFGEGGTAYKSTMKQVISQVGLNGINLESPSAATMLGVDAKTKSRVMMAYKWSMSHCDASEKNLLSPLMIPAGAVEYVASRKKVEAAALSVVTKSLAELKELQWEIANEKAKLGGRAKWNDAYKKEAPHIVKCNTVANVVEKRNAADKKVRALQKIAVPACFSGKKNT